MEHYGLYVHVPFCRSRCPYCAFVSSTALENAQLFVSSVIREITLRASPRMEVDTVHFGGGTPTVLPAKELARILSVLRASFGIGRGAEIALEANPGTVDFESLKVLRGAGFNRLSLGFQSFDGEDLRFLGRGHEAWEARDAFDAARRAGFENLGIDLIYGLPGRGAAPWGAQLEAAVALEPEHLSCYALTIEPGTRFEKESASGAFSLPGEERARELFLLTHERLAELGYPAYEVSNFSRGGLFPSRHNSKYWTLAPYLGFGPSAHSYEPPLRSWNARSLDDYADLCLAGGSPAQESETLSPAQSALEFASLGLRTAAGVNLVILEEKYSPGFSARNSGALASMLEKGLATLQGDFLKPTLAGLLFSDRLPLSFDF